LVKAIINLINNESLRIELGRIGRERAEKEFDAQKIAKKLEKIYEKVIRY